MFNKLKEKLSGFKKALSKTIDEKAVAIEPIEEEAPKAVKEVSEEQEIEEEGLEEEIKAEAEHRPKLLEKAEEKPLEPKVSSESISNSSKEGLKEVLENASGVVKVEASEKAEPAEALPEKKSFFKKVSKVGFAKKAKALVFNREVYLESKDLEEPLWELEMALLESDLALSVSEAIVDSVKTQLAGTRKHLGANTGLIVEEALKKAILDVVSANTLDFDEYIKKQEKPIHIVFVGINGTGKTTSIAKLTKRLQNSGYSVVLAAADTFRAGAIDQLEVHAKRLGVKMIKHQEGADPAAVVYDAVQYAKSHKVDLILSDTAGRMHTNVNLMVQMEKICRVSTPDLVIFVDEAVAGNDAVERAAQFNEAVPIDGSILTKIDADAKGGAAISIAYITGKPILFLGIGQGYDDLKKFDPEWFVDQLFNS
ncbi:MAG: signal recognition particle-docking protein FtsY [Methanosarcinaceae archaeon]|nr:signal recognition particle-docking protein FtsY [Methanosarcinaceae archaeon]MDD4749383.1 signal recognition particle-docking protein FtsY [Methanosarcinaceae archaeon]